MMERKGKVKKRKRKSRSLCFFSQVLTNHCPESTSNGFCHPKALYYFYPFLNLSDLFRQSIVNTQWAGKKPLKHKNGCICFLHFRRTAEIISGGSFVQEDLQMGFLGYANLGQDRFRVGMETKEQNYSLLSVVKNFAFVSC